MNPSSSSNAESPRASTFKVGTRQLSADFTEVGPACNPRDLGTLPASQFTELVAKLTGLAAEKLLDDDPHLVVAARRGRFIVRPAKGKIRLFEVDDAMRTPLEMPADAVASYLDGTELKAGAPELAEGGIAEAPPSRAGLAIFLLVLSLAMAGGSAYFTFQTQSIDPDSEYSALAPERIGAIRQQIPGVYTTGNGTTPRTLTIRAGGTLSLVETGPDNAVMDQREDGYQLMLRRGSIPVARASHLGPIEIRDPKTVFYAGELYSRQP